MSRWIPPVLLGAVVLVILPCPAADVQPPKRYAEAVQALERWLAETMTTA